MLEQEKYSVTTIHLISFHQRHFQLLDPTYLHSICFIYNKARTNKSVHVPRSHIRNNNSMKDEAIICSLKPNSLAEILTNENYLDKWQDKEFKRML